jgi:glycosyltransferase involved in cell wall biosynthesis
VKLLIDFTGPLGADTGGATYAANFLPSWRDQFDEDELVAVFSYKQAPTSLRGLDGVVVECARSGGPASMDRLLLDRHLALRRQLAGFEADVAYFPGNFVAAALPKELPVAVAVRSLLQYHYPSQISRLRGAYRKLATAHSVRRADRVIVPSSATADDLMRLLGVHRRKLAVVPHGVDLDAFRPDDAVRVEPGRFLFVSKPWDYKGLATVMRALPLLCDGAARGIDVELVVADGGTSDEELSHWRRLAESLGVGERVRFLGRLAHDRLAVEYQRACALVLPVSIESFGNAFLEAAASGCPVITGSGYGIDETIGPVATQVPAHRHTDLAEAMIACTRMSEAQRSEQAGALRAWAERFPWSRAVAQTRGVLAEVAR